jgi:hypothetical protein
MMPFQCLKELMLLEAGPKQFHQDPTACIPYKSCFQIIEDVKSTCLHKEPLRKRITATTQCREDFKAFLGKVQNGFTWTAPNFLHMALCERRIEHGRDIGGTVAITRHEGGRREEIAGQYLRTSLVILQIANIFGCMAAD